MKTIEFKPAVSLRASLIEMEPGETRGVRVESRSYAYVRHIASIVGMEHSRKYSVHLNQEEGQYEITRTI